MSDVDVRIRGSQTDTSSLAIPDRAPRSYFINGWNDFFLDQLGSGPFWGQYMAGTYPKGMKEELVIHPSDTVMFGEKKNIAQATANDPLGAMDYYMDMFEGQGGNDADRIEHGCHSVLRKGERAGGSNYAWVDGSVRYVKYGRTVTPLNMWAVTDSNRISTAFVPP